MPAVIELFARSIIFKIKNLAKEREYVRYNTESSAECNSRDKNPVAILFTRDSSLIHRSRIRLFDLDPLPARKHALLAHVLQRSFTRLRSLVHRSTLVLDSLSIFGVPRRSGREERNAHPPADANFTNDLARDTRPHVRCSVRLCDVKRDCERVTSKIEDYAN